MIRPSFRFAPSPTGYLHVGNARTAIIAWLAAKAAGGRFMLRIDDTDSERSKKEYEAAIEEDLMWLGLSWNDKANQSARLDRYDEIIQSLKDCGRLYPCYETPEELGLKRKAALLAGRPPIYDRAALTMTVQQKADYEAQGRRPHWRFRLDHTPITWNDLIRGPVRFEGGDLSDPVLIREDGTPLFNLCSVIDDADFRITHIVRGEDHVANTASQIQMFVAIGAAPPLFAHLPLVTAAGGDKLSKRTGSLSIRDLRDEEGLEPMAILSLLSRLGTSDAIEALDDRNTLIAGFDFAKFSRNAPKFDEAELLRLNAKLLHDMPFEAVKDRAACDEALWHAVRDNIERVGEAATWARIVYEKADWPVPEADAPFLRQAADALPSLPWDGGTWAAWTVSVKAATGRKGRDLFLPLRLALTGREHGPEMAALLPLMGIERAKERLMRTC